jgi:hypothetical protein
LPLPAPGAKTHPLASIVGRRDGPFAAGYVKARIPVLVAGQSLDIGYFADGKLKKIPASGGPSQGDRANVSR